MQAYTPFQALSPDATGWRLQRQDSGSISVAGISAEEIRGRVIFLAFSVNRQLSFGPCSFAAAKDFDCGRSQEFP
jgi:hypothetical protein